MTDRGTRSGPARWLRRLAVPIVLGWVALAAALNTVVPQLEVVGQMRAVSMSPDYAPSVTAMHRVGEIFGEFSSDSSVMIVLEGDHPLGDDAHRYYGTVVAKLTADHRHVEHVQDFWGDPLTAPGAQSTDGRAAYVQVYLAGDQGEPLANESVEAVQSVIDETPSPTGVTAYVTGPAALAVDEHKAGDRSAVIIEALTFAVIITLMLIVYRSVGTALIVLAMVVVELSSARGAVALMAYHHLVGLTTFVSNLLVTLAIAAATDYAIFLVGRYQEARTAGEDRESAYYTMFHGTAHVVLASGSTIAGATLCLHFTRLPYFQTLGIPLAAGMIVVTLAALTLGPAVITLATRFGRLEPRRAMRIRGWRKIGALIVRWPGPVLGAAMAVSLVGLLMLPGYRTSYNERRYLPADLPATAGYAAAERHFSTARLNPEILLVETNRDLRDPAGLLMIERIARTVVRAPGVSRVQAITRPDGTPLKFSSLPAQLGMQSNLQALNLGYLEDRTADMRAQIDDLQSAIDTMRRLQSLMAQMSAATGSMVDKTHQMSADIDQLRSHLADFDDFLRPVRNYLAWEPHCSGIPACWSLRSGFDALDGTDTLSADIAAMLPDLDALDASLPQLLGLMPAQIASLERMKTLMATMVSTQAGQLDQQAALLDDQNAMGKAFNDAKNDDTFYLPPDVFANAEFLRGMKNFISPDGRDVRFIVTPDGDPLTPEGIGRIDDIRAAAKEAIKGTPLEGSEIRIAGTAPFFKDMQEGNNYDLMIAGIAALSLIFSIMLVITRSLVAAAVIVGTVVVSLGTSFGLSILVWQHLLGLELHFMVMAMALIILLAVGADYNLLLVARFKEEMHAGLDTAIIRGMGGTGSVVTSAGLVFALTMMSMAVSELTVVAQIGTTIGLGLLFDTLVIRSFLTPSIAAVLGRWFWWPLPARRRPVPARWPEKVAEGVNSPG